jgi:drug/metabolite transporter (DMT)-like permease
MQYTIGKEWEQVEMEKSRFIRQNVCPVLAAMIWGMAFVAQSVGADYVGPFTFNAVRAFIAFVALILLCWILRRGRKKKAASAVEFQMSRGYRRDLIRGSVFCGIFICLATNLQQSGLATTAPGKAGFITTMYIVIVPVLGLFLKKKVGKQVWLGVVLAVGGLYFLCLQNGFSLEKGDLLICLCSLALSVHILVIDHFTQKVDSVELSCGQFLFMALASAVGMVVFEHPTWSAILACIWPLLYLGIFSSAVAYTLQILAQKGSNPTVVSLLLSRESVFATLSGALVLGDRMSGREYFGCALMLAAVVLAQLPGKKKTEQLA